MWPQKKIIKDINTIQQQLEGISNVELLLLEHFRKNEELLLNLQMAILDPNGAYYKRLFFDNLRIPYDQRSIFYSLDEESICIDCGSHAGLFIDLCSINGGKVFGFEPNYSLFEILKQKHKDNTNVSINQKAVGIKNEIAHFYRLDENKDILGHHGQAASYIKFFFIICYGLWFPLTVAHNRGFSIKCNQSIRKNETYH